MPGLACHANNFASVIIIHHDIVHKLIKTKQCSRNKIINVPATSGHLTKNHDQRGGLCPHKLSWGGRDLTGAGKLQKFNIWG